MTGEDSLREGDSRGGFQERPHDTESPASNGNTEPWPAVTFSGDPPTCRILTVAYEAMGEPEAVRCYLKGLTMGIEPCDPDHAHAYPLYEQRSTHSFSAGWMRYELELEDHLNGMVKLEYDDELGFWTADLGRLIKAGDGDETTVDDALAALRTAGEYLEDHELHEEAHHVGRAYNKLKEKRQELRRKDRLVSKRDR